METLYDYAYERVSGIINDLYSLYEEDNAQAVGEGLLQQIRELERFLRVINVLGKSAEANATEYREFFNRLIEDMREWDERLAEVDEDALTQYLHQDANDETKRETLRNIQTNAYAIRQAMLRKEREINDRF